ncbi:MAG TPA: hypothetical protein VH596_15575 [Terriglobales bacterium]
MSAAAQLWRQIVSRVETASDSSRSAPAMVVNSVSKPEYSLIHQLFFPSLTVRRTSILLATTDKQVRAARLSERLATALASVTGEKIAVIEAGGQQDLVGKGRGSTLAVMQADGQKNATATSGSVHKIAFELIKSELDGLEKMREEFGYFLLCASMADCEMPAFCNLCDAAVLVLTANMTRREAARRAQEQLVRQGVTVLGVVLDERKLPIPEPIYRRL